MLMLYKDCFFFRTLDPGGPLRSMTPLHFSLLDAIWTASGSEHPHQPVMSSDTAVFLPVVHEVDRPPPFWASLSSPVAGHSSYRCPNSCNFLCFTTSTIVQCLCTLSLTMLLLTLSFQHTVNILLISFRMPGVFWSLRLLLSTSRQHRADDKRHAHQSSFWSSTRYCSRTSLAFPISGMRGWSYL